MFNYFVKKLNNRKGFTLIELIVVIAILGILAAIAIPRFTTATDSAKNKSNLSEHRIAVSAVQMYMADHDGGLPANSTALDDYIQGGWAGLISGTHTYAVASGVATVTSVSTASTPVTTTTTID